MYPKIENESSQRLTQSAYKHIKLALDSVPRDHLRGLDKVVFVDDISDSRLKLTSKTTKLPGLYHPKQGSRAAFLEVALDVLLPRSNPFYKRIVSKLSFKANVAAVLFSLVGQHYFLTLRHSVKRNQLESSVRGYTEKQLKQWHEQQQGFRARLFKPLQPRLEKWGRSLQKRARASKTA